MPENFNNKRYLIRAIERDGHESKTNEVDKSFMIIGINPDKETLSQRIVDRAEVIFNSNVLLEAKKLFEEYGYDCPGASGNIYRVLKSHFIDGLPLLECKNKFITLDKKLAKRQLTWFKRNKNIKWFNSALEAEKYLGSIL
jgi:tRNA dimethylallyltransferase